MTNESERAIESMSLQTKGQESSYRINQYLQQGAYQLIITAPFDTRVAVTPLNPPAGFQFFPDQDGSAEIWNSRIVTPQNGQYAFLIRLDKPVNNSQLYIQFILQTPAPPPEPPITPSPPPPQPPSAPPGDMQEFYRQQRYTIASDGSDYLLGLMICTILCVNCSVYKKRIIHIDITVRDHLPIAAWRSKARLILQFKSLMIQRVTAYLVPAA